MSGHSEISVGESAAEAAADWFVRLQAAAATHGDWLAFERWLLADPINALAYEDLEALWVDLEHANFIPDLGARPVTGVRRAARPRLGRRSRRRAGFAAAAALAAGLAAAAIGVAFWPQPVPTQVFRTAPGQVRQITLADGTRINLNVASTISVRLGRGARQVEMSDGEAVFDVAHDAVRPFLIAVGDREVRVVGTEFNLRRRDGRLALTVRRGAVEVRPTDAPDSAPTMVAKGQALAHTQGDDREVLRASDPDAAFAWTSGQLIYRNQPMSDVAADLTRRFATPVRTADARTASLRFSGVLVTDSEPAVLRRLEAFAPVRADPTNGAIVLRHR